jgi:hypothetical protein
MAKSEKRGKKTRVTTICVPGEGGSSVKVNLIRPAGKGKVSGKQMIAVIKKVRDARLKAQPVG